MQTTMMIKQIKSDSKRSICFIVVSLFLVLPLYAQYEAQTSQYMFNTSAFNAASIGENGMINVIGQHRTQWVGMPGAPQTTLFNINAPFKSGAITHGVGIKFLTDKIGAFSNQSASLQYAYKRNFGKNRVSIGAGIGFVSVSFIADSVRQTINSDYHKISNDTKIPTSDETGIGADISLSAFFSAPQYYIGLSYVHLNSPTVKLGDRSTFKVGGVFYGTGGYDVALTDSKLMIRSNALLKTDFVSFQTEISSRLEYDKSYWGGLSYRFQDAVVVFAGMNIFNGVSLGYAYDIPVGRIIKASSGSHEIFLSYSFGLDMSKNKNKYKSIRLL